MVKKSGAGAGAVRLKKKSGARASKKFAGSTALPTSLKKATYKPMFNVHTKKLGPAAAKFENSLLYL